MSILFESCTCRFGDIMEQNGSKEQHACLLRELSLALQAHQYLSDHPGMDEHIPLSMIGRILWDSSHCTYPAKMLLNARPIQLESRRSRTEREGPQGGKSVFQTTACFHR